MKRFEIGASEAASQANVDGVTLAYERWGAGVPVICLHAIGHGAQDFAPLAKLVGGEAELIALDWPGQGRSGDDRMPVSAERYCALLEGFVEALALDRFVLLGNSIGGAAALLYADRHPEQVRGLVLSNPGGLAPVTGFSRFAIGRMVAFFKAGVARRWWFGPAFRIYYGRVLLRRAAAKQRRRIVAARHEIARPLMQAWQSFAAPEADIGGICPRLKMPVLYAWAVKDQIVPLSKSLDAVKTTPEYELIRFRAGHMPALETPKLFAAAFLRFLRRLP